MWLSRQLNSFSLWGVTHSRLELVHLFYLICTVWAILGTSVCVLHYNHKSYAIDRSRIFHKPALHLWHQTKHSTRDCSSIIILPDNSYGHGNAWAEGWHETTTTRWLLFFLSKQQSAMWTVEQWKHQHLISLSCSNFNLQLCKTIKRLKVCSRPNSKIFLHFIRNIPLISPPSRWWQT